MSGYPGNQRSLGNSESNPNQIRGNQGRPTYPPAPPLAGFDQKGKIQATVAPQPLYNPIYNSPYPANHAPPLAPKVLPYPPNTGNRSSSSNAEILPTSNVDMKKMFFDLDTDGSGQIGAEELQKALVNGNWSPFSLDACRMMISIYDKYSSGSIGVDEFRQIFASIVEWKKIFERYDVDNSGSIDRNELHQAFQQMGYGLTEKFVESLLMKYDPRLRVIKFDTFITICIQLKRASDGFRMRDRCMQGQVTLKYEDFVGLTMGLHN